MNPAAMDCQRFLFLDLSESSHYQRYQSLAIVSNQTAKRMAGTMKVVAMAEFLEIPRTVRNEKKTMKVFRQNHHLVKSLVPCSLKTAKVDETRH